MSLRRVWLNVHLTLALALVVLLVPIAVTGAILVAQDSLDPWLHPARYGLTKAPARDLDAFMASAQAAFGPDIVVSSLRLPEEPGSAVMVTGRGGQGGRGGSPLATPPQGQSAGREGSLQANRERGGEPGTAERRAPAGRAERGQPESGTSAGGPPRFLAAYVDPADAHVIEVADFRNSFFGTMHFIHENLLIPQWSGRAIVGWTGVAMLILSLTGIWLWWPRNGALLRALRWRRSTATTSNLHHTLGFWIALPLAAVSLTGIYLGFPQQGRQLVATFAEVGARGGPPGLQGGGGRPPALTASDVAAAALAATPAGARLVSLDKPGAAGPTLWRAQVVAPGAEATTVMVDDTTREATIRGTAQLPGDRIQQMIRWIHEGSHFGPVWKVLVFLTGVFPPIFAITGVTMWLRRRQQERRMRALRAAAPAQPAARQKIA